MEEEIRVLREELAAQRCLLEMVYANRFAYDPAGFTDLMTRIISLSREQTAGQQHGTAYLEQFHRTVDGRIAHEREKNRGPGA